VYLNKKWLVKLASHFLFSKINYQNYSEAKGIITFVAIGVGGTADNPEELFIVPLQELKSDFISKSDLMPFKKTDLPQNKFFFDPKSGVLK
jgi:hypothetical protein